jgi:hypothetical protein
MVDAGAGGDCGLHVSSVAGFAERSTDIYGHGRIEAEWRARLLVETVKFD